MTLPAGVATATDVIECDQSAISIPVIVFTEELETLGTIAFARSGWPDSNRRPLDPQNGGTGRKPLHHKDPLPLDVLHSTGSAELSD